MAKAETDEVVKAQQEASKHGHRLWRNNRGMFYTMSGEKTRAGLSADGSSDLIGYATVTITPEMVGKEIAVFLAGEGKKPGWKGVKTETEKQQEKFINHVNGRGGIAFFFDDGENILKYIQNGVDRLNGID